ncbi:823dc3c9-e006-4603-b031-2aae6b72bddc [Thermothielavioides terrestris]|uniref:823dc3c9-e006-4603-b031-2aae6b72bddc n=1 Tax=Thermothielavioides terrestris TaxID=2587410 RepID=A0A446BR29_9PEZI|nr:823dc3c9-e006-4603-b031-2aae6b72bddc [Thermothielavioides terrestris]
MSPQPRRTTTDGLESRTRTTGHFSDTESSLASVSTNQSQAARKEHKITRLLSYLGSNNPLPAEIAADDVVWLMDNTAFRDAKGAWQAEFVAAAFDKQPSARVLDIVGEIAHKVGLSKGAKEEETIERRIGPFVMEVLPDIDDTIKVTQTSDPVGILRSTFVSEPTPIDGMPELYGQIRELVTPSAPFFYLSASPYNLYPFLRSFRDAYYPHGQLILRDASWMTVSGLLSSLTLGTEKYKVDRIRKIHGWLPRRKLICIGDSTQSDPEAYGDAYRAFPGWIKLILIRKVTDIAAIGIREKNEPERFEKAFAGVPRETWHVFEDPAECRQLVQMAVGKH